MDSLFVRVERLGLEKILTARMGIALGESAFDAKQKAETAAHKILIRTATDPEWRGQEERRMHVT